MAGRLDQIESMLRPYLGTELLGRCPEIVYAVNAQLVRFMHSDDTLAVLWHKIDSALFNAVYVGTERTMLVRLDDGKQRRITSERLRDLSDRLLALCYCRREANTLLRDMLFDLAREGSFAAMRELLLRYELDAFDREWLTQVLEENNQLQ
ncbi:MAG: hypothetical protein J6K32_05925 [Clostridia bacterium]|nr:hypothetical protein [Clostridia bacterium]